MKNSRQIFPSGIAPYVDTPSTLPEIDFTNVDGDIGELPHNLGNLTIASQKHGTLLNHFVNNREVFQGSEDFVGIDFGFPNKDDIDTSYPAFFGIHEGVLPLDLVIPANNYLKVQYEDNENKHPSLQYAYRVTLMVDYIEEHDDLRALPQEVQDKIYDAFEKSGKYFSEIIIKEEDGKVMIANADSKTPEWVTPESIILNSISK